MSGTENEESAQSAPKWNKGDRAAIVAGRKNPLGIRGEVFWIGENKYGPGMRYGLKGDDGETYWCDETHLGSESDAPPAPEPRPEDALPVLKKGSRVEITGGREGLGEKGEVFWVGDSKFGKGMRYGIRDGDNTYWIDEQFVTLLSGPDEGGGGGDGGRPSAGPVATDGAPPPLDDNFADEFSDDIDGGWPSDDDAPLPDPDAAPNVGEPPPDDAPMPDDDLPF